MSLPTEDDVQHCPECGGEFVVGVTACSDCGAPLRRGPMPRNAMPQDKSETPPLAPGDPPDALIAQMPGVQAELAAKALALEGVICLLECEGVRQIRLPGDEPSVPLAVTLPVSIYVPRTRVAEAKDILESAAREDVVGDQWAEPGRVDAGPAEGESAPAIDAAVFSEPEEHPETGFAGLHPSAPRPEGTAHRFLLLIALLGFLLFALLKH